MPSARARTSRQRDTIHHMKSIFAAICLLVAATAAAQRKPGNPLEHLPPNIEILTHFGERADISPDNRSIAFMNKSFGDAFTIDLQTRVIRCLTCNVPGAAFAPPKPAIC